MDFVDCLFVYDVDEVVIDNDLKEPNNSCGDDISSKNIFNLEGGLFNSLAEIDYFHPCAYGDNVDEELHFDVNGDNDEEINHCFKDLNFHEWENLKANEPRHNIQSKIWVANAFNAWQAKE